MISLPFSHNQIQAIVVNTNDAPKIIHYSTTYYYLYQLSQMNTTDLSNTAFIITHFQRTHIRLFQQMGNDNNKQSTSADGNKVTLRLRNRDIILHYAFKMKLLISDIALFPHELEGLRLWDIDIVLARFAILESSRFRTKDVMVFRAGVGIAGIALKQWADCKNVVMCDTRDEVVGNMANNCEKNGLRNVSCIKIQQKDLFKFTSKFDCVLFPDVLNLGYSPQMVIEMMRRYLKNEGQGIIVMPENKDLAKKLLDLVDRREFKINNLLLTAQEYELSPLFNKMEGESQFPLLGKTKFYVIILTKINNEKPVQSHEKKTIALKPIEIKPDIKQESTKINQQKTQTVEKTANTSPVKQQSKTKQQMYIPVCQSKQPERNQDQKEYNNQSPIKEINNQPQTIHEHISSPTNQQKQSQ